LITQEKENKKLDVLEKYMRKRKDEIAEEWEKRYKNANDEGANHEAYAYTMAYDFLIDMIDELKHADTDERIKAVESMLMGPRPLQVWR
jgi:guanylate kinase